MKTKLRILSVVMLLAVSAGCMAQEGDIRSFGTFFVEYNPNTWHDKASSVMTKRSYQGLSVGFSYFFPVVGGLGFDAGLKGQYLFSKKTIGGVDRKDNLMAATVPVDVTYHLPVFGGVVVAPFAGLYGRYNLSAYQKEKNAEGKWISVNLLDKNQTGLSDDYAEYKRFQYGWQVGANVHVSELFTLGASYWADLSEIHNQTKLHGFSFRLGFAF